MSDNEIKEFDFLWVACIFLVNECGASLITPINKDGFNPLQLSKRISNESEVDKEIYSFLRKIDERRIKNA